MHSTAPRADSTRQTAAASTLAVHWVHPEPRLVPLEDSAVVFGRGATGWGRIDGSEVSRSHARVRRDGPLWLLEDLGSRNGSYVDGNRCQGAPLALGSVLRLGEWVGVVVQGIAPGDPPATFAELAPGVWGGRQLSRALEPVRRGAASDLPVVVEGETGTGKECVARTVHTWSTRTGPFLAMNCAALPEHLAEGELFGYRRGAFTGADRASPGHFRSANGGTLLLDEFAELSLALQAKLLRVLEQGEVTPLGESQPVRVDVRLVVATQEPLSRAMNEQRLRPDLFARLDGIGVELPPLSARLEEVPGLFRHFLQAFSGGSPPPVEASLIEQLCLYDWPFNVREVQLLARRLLVLHGHEPSLKRRYLPERIRGTRANGDSAPPVPANSIPRAVGLPPQPAGTETREQRDERELAALTEGLRANGGNVARTCAALGISRSRAYRLMHRGTGVDLDALRQDGLAAKEAGS